MATLLEPKDEDTNAISAERKKCQHDEFICYDHILNTLSDQLHDMYTNTTSAKGNWNALENKYKFEEEGIKKLLISRYFDFKFLKNIPLLSKVHELQVLLNN